MNSSSIMSWRFEGSYAHCRERSALARERHCLGWKMAQKSYFSGPNMQKLATTLMTNIMYI